MKKSPDFLGGVKLGRLFLEPPNTQHLTQEMRYVLTLQR
jgi:hypothetical protein